MVLFNVAACLFTVLCMGLTLYSLSAVRRERKAFQEERADQTAARVAGAMAARLETMREAAERADLIRITSEQAGIALQAAKDAQHYADLADEILSSRPTDPALGGMAVMAVDPEEDGSPDTERSGVVVAFPGTVRS